jgi:hypothetical protein
MEAGEKASMVQLNTDPNHRIRVRITPRGATGKKRKIKGKTGQKREEQKKGQIKMGRKGGDTRGLREKKPSRG